MKCVGLRSFSTSCFPAFGLNTDQKNSLFGQFSCNEPFRDISRFFEYSLHLNKLQGFENKKSTEAVVQRYPVKKGEHLGQSLFFNKVY